MVYSINKNIITVAIRGFIKFSFKLKEISFRAANPYKIMVIKNAMSALKGAPSILISGIGIKILAVIILIIIPTLVTAAGRMIEPEAWRREENNCCMHKKMSEGERMLKSFDAALVLNSSKSIFSEKKNIAKAQGRVIIIVSLNAREALFLTPLLFFRAICPLITGSMAELIAPIIPTGRLKTVRANPE